MADQMTEREAALAARVKELEEAQKKATITTAQGGIFEGLWRAVNAVVPPWLAVLGLAVFFGHYGLEAYLGAQVADAETALTLAKKDVEKAKADAANSVDENGTRLRLKQVQEELRLKQAQAAQAQVNADAQTALINGESTKLTEVLTQLAGARNQASLARAKADAEGAKFGLQTLEQRGVRAKLILQQLKIIDNRASIAQTRALGAVGNGSGDLVNGYKMMTQAFCEDNQFADLIGCPAQYIHHNPPSAALPPAQGQLAAIERAAQDVGPGNAVRYATIKTLGANLRPCAEPSNQRCPPMEPPSPMQQGFSVKILGEADNGWFQVEARDAATGKVYRGFVNGNVLKF